MSLRFIWQKQQKPKRKKLKMEKSQMNWIILETPWSGRGTDWCSLSQSPPHTPTHAYTHSRTHTKSCTHTHALVQHAHGSHWHKLMHRLTLETHPHPHTEVHTRPPMLLALSHTHTLKQTLYLFLFLFLSQKWTLSRLLLAAEIHIPWHTKAKTET